MHGPHPLRPSPTGYLHIGGVRTALFNWLFARQHGGQFILRIDDTDQQRNVPEALQPILDGFRWLGLDWDEGPEVGGPHGPYYQSQKLDRYQAAVRELLDKGLAYWDYATPEEMKAEREAAEKEKRPYLYSRRWMAETPTARSSRPRAARAVVRLKMPREGAAASTTTFASTTRWCARRCTEPRHQTNDGASTTRWRRRAIPSSPPTAARGTAHSPPPGRTKPWPPTSSAPQDARRAAAASRPQRRSSNERPR